MKNIKRIFASVLFSIVLSTASISSYSATTYSDNWYMDTNQVWHYKMADGSICSSSWVEDMGNWYLLDASGNMLSGVFQSYGKYYLLDTQRNTGTFGKLLKNGAIYQGITIQADTSANYEGALSQNTINQLQAKGVGFSSVPNISGTQHVSAGIVTVAGASSGSGASQAQVQQQTAQVQSSGMDNSFESHMIDNQKAIQDLQRGMSGIDFEEYFKGVTFY